MHPGYLAGSLVALCFGVAFFLTPKTVRRLSGVLDRSVGSSENVILKKRGMRYVFGLALFGVSLLLFRMAYTLM